MKLKDVLAADEAFMTNSVLGIMPLTSISGELISRGRVGPLTKNLSRTYDILVKQNL